MCVNLGPGREEPLMAFVPSAAPSSSSSSDETSSSPTSDASDASDASYLDADG